jgi:hypothetical protein
LCIHCIGVYINNHLLTNSSKRSSTLFPAIGNLGFDQFRHFVGRSTGMGIGYKLQLDTVLKNCLKTRKRERKPLKPVGDVTEKLVAIARPAGLRS